MRHILRLDGQDHQAALTGPGNARTLLLDDASLAATLVQGAGGAATLQLAGASWAVHVAREGDRVFVWLDGEVYQVDVLEPLDVHARAASESGLLQTHAPMPGSVVALPVALGDVVQAGATLVIIESMKLEVALKATRAGRVAAIDCAVGGSFAKDAVLVTLAAEEG